MIELKPIGAKRVAIQLMTHEAAYICNIDEIDVAKMVARKPGTFVVIHHAIRLDAMFEDRFETHRTKVIETSSIDFYQSFQKNGAHHRR